MSRIWTRRPRSDAPKGERLERSLREEMAWAAGTQAFQHRDPLYHVTENFHQTFDAIGRKHAEQLAGSMDAGAEPEYGEAPQQPDPTSARAFYERSVPDSQEMIRRFSEITFQRGTLSGAVLRGTGRMMLFSCLKKTVGQSQPDKWQQRKLFEKVAVRRNSPGHSPDKFLFNRGFTDSAVGLVVDTLRGARRTVEDLRDIALGKRGGGAGAGTLLTMYPFLDDSRERELLEQYRAQLEGSGSGDPDGHAALQNAVVRMEALIAKKVQMKQEFINKLNFQADRATEALGIFEEPGFSAALDQALREAAGAEEPPPGGGEGEGDGTEKREPDPPADGGAAPDGADGTPDSPDGAGLHRSDRPDADGGCTSGGVVPGPSEGAGQPRREQRDGGHPGGPGAEA